MSNFPLAPGAAYDTYGAGTGSTNGTQISTSGLYTQIIGSATRCYDAILVQINQQSNNTTTLVTIAIGGSGSEQTIATLNTPNFSFGSQIPVPSYYLLPITVPVGSRISAKYAYGAGGSDIWVLITGISGALLADHGCPYGEMFGVNSIVYGTIVDPGSTANTLGAWTQITASTAHNYSYLTFVSGDNGTEYYVDKNWLVDIGIGPSGSETVLIPQLFLYGDTDLNIPTPWIIGPLHVSIPAGTRIAVRCQCTDNTAANREISVGLIGFVR